MVENIHPIFDGLVSRSERERMMGQQSAVFWFTGLSGSGKSTIVKGVERTLFDKGYAIQVLDGDNIRTGICNNLSFSMEDRSENIRRISEVSKLYINSGIIALCSFISPTKKIRAMARTIVGDSDFHEIYVNTPLEICEQRDVKGLYKKARAGEIQGFTGIDSPYEAPQNPLLNLKTELQSIEESVAEVVDVILKNVAL